MMKTELKVLTLREELSVLLSSQRLHQLDHIHFGTVRHFPARMEYLTFLRTGLGQPPGHECFSAGLREISAAFKWTCNNGANGKIQ